MNCSTQIAENTVQTCKGTIKIKKNKTKNYTQIKKHTKQDKTTQNNTQQHTTTHNHGSSNG